MKTPRTKYWYHWEVGTSRVTSVNQELESCPHYICPHHLLQQLLLLLLLLWCVVLPLARTGVVVVEELGQSWVHWHRLHGRRHGLEQRGGGAVLGVTIVSGAAQLQLYHGAHIVGVHTEEQLRQLLQFCVGEGAGGSPALFVIVRAAVAVLGTLGVALAGQGGVVPGTALALAGALGALRPVVRAAVGVCLAGRVTLTREAAVEGILNRGVRWRCSDIATLTSTLWHFDIVTLSHFYNVTMGICDTVTLLHCYTVTLWHLTVTPPSTGVWLAPTRYNQTWRRSDEDLYLQVRWRLTGK